MEATDDAIEDIVEDDDTTMVADVAMSDIPENAEDLDSDQGDAVASGDDAPTSPVRASNPEPTGDMGARTPDAGAAGDVHGEKSDVTGSNPTVTPTDAGGGWSSAVPRAARTPVAPVVLLLVLSWAVRRRRTRGEAAASGG